MNMAMMNLSGVADEDSLSCALVRVPKSRILVIEDIDHYRFDEGLPDKKDETKAYKKNSSLSVSGILSAMDGIACLKESSKCARVRLDEDRQTYCIIVIFMACNDMNSIPPPCTHSNWKNICQALHGLFGRLSSQAHFLEILLYARKRDLAREYAH